jgi:hypothetical protein
MDAKEKAVLDEDQDKMMRQGYPKQTRWRWVNANANTPLTKLIFHRLAEKHLVECVEKNTWQQWLEMGVLSMTLTTYTAPTGLMVTDLWVRNCWRLMPMPIIVMNMFALWWALLPDLFWTLDMPEAVLAMVAAQNRIVWCTTTCRWLY